MKIFNTKPQWKAIISLVVIMLTAFAEPGQKGGRRVSFPEGIKHIRNIPYAGTDNPRQMLDLLVPKQRADRPLPIVVYIHGGGWRKGNKTPKLSMVANFADSGQYIAASIAYRLSGEVKWPAQVHDCKAAIRWIRVNAEKYGIDPDRIGVWGASAGGICHPCWEQATV
ncbi:MAG: alpha/beta hydrolase [Planctomycetes bacterium]|nr:alpha/beta hydrolase [Planctomycetota bacterium]